MGAKMAISEAPANVAVKAMQAIPFNSMIGGPLKACIEAQAMAAQTTWEFIQNVGLNTDKDGEKKAVNVSFSFNPDGTPNGKPYKRQERVRKICDEGISFPIDTVYFIKEQKK